MDGSWLAFILRMNEKPRGLSAERLQNLFDERDDGPHASSFGSFNAVFVEESLLA